MKLIIKRNQKAQTGIFGGHKGTIFILSYSVELTPEEQALVAKYRVEDYPLMKVTGADVTMLTDTIALMSLKELTHGRTEELKDIGVLLNTEEVIKDACKGFKIFLEVMASFGGKEVFEF